MSYTTIMSDAVSDDDGDEEQAAAAAAILSLQAFDQMNSYVRIPAIVARRCLIGGDSPGQATSGKGEGGSRLARPAGREESPHYGPERNDQGTE
jgi:hypothetical protein